MIYYIVVITTQKTHYKSNKNKMKKVTRFIFYLFVFSFEFYFAKHHSWLSPSLSFLLVSSWQFPYFILVYPICYHEQCVYIVNNGCGFSAQRIFFFGIFLRNGVMLCNLNGLKKVTLKDLDSGRFTSLFCLSTYQSVKQIRRNIRKVLDQSDSEVQ